MKISLAALGNTLLAETGEGGTLQISKSNRGALGAVCLAAVVTMESRCGSCPFLSAPKWDEHPSEMRVAFSGQELLFLSSNADRNGCQRTGSVSWTWQALAVFCPGTESGISHRKTQVPFSKYYSKIPSRVLVNNMALIFSRAFLFQPSNSKHILKEQERGEVHECCLESMSDNFCCV